MNTRYLTFSETDLVSAGQIIRDGGLVAFPTETVYGLGANALDVLAVEKTFKAKGRPSDNPLIVHIYEKSQIYDIASYVSLDAEKVIKELMPGSLTVVLPKKAVIDSSVTANLDTVAIRMPSSEQAREFLRYCRVPVTAPSANTSSRPSPTVWQTVKEDLDGKIDAILMGKECEVGIESTVLDMSGLEPLILRPGIITPNDISKVLQKKVRIVTDFKEKVNSPGVKYKHYAPSCPMALNLDGDANKLIKLYDEIKKKGLEPVLLVKHPEFFPGRNTYPIGLTDEIVARNIFSNLRFLEKKYGYIIASFTGETDFSVSVINRLIKSAGQNIV